MGPMPGSFSSSKHAGAVFGQQLVALRQRAGGGDGLQVGGHALADAGNLQQARGVGATAIRSTVVCSAASAARR